MDRARAADRALASAGARVEEATPPGDGHALTLEVWRSYGPGMTSRALYQLLRRWDQYRAQLLEWMTAWDAILTPAFDCPAPPHGATEFPDLQHAVRWTTPWSLTGWPGTVVRRGTSPKGLPIGVQLVAAPLAGPPDPGRRQASGIHPRLATTPGHPRDPGRAAPTRRARLTRARRCRGPRWGSVAQPGDGRVGLSTGPGVLRKEGRKPAEGGTERGAPGSPGRAGGRHQPSSSRRSSSMPK
jgi:Amidase